MSVCGASWATKKRDNERKEHPALHAVQDIIYYKVLT